MKKRGKKTAGLAAKALLFAAMAALAVYLSFALGKLLVADSFSTYAGFEGTRLYCSTAWGRYGCAVPVGLAVLAMAVLGLLSYGWRNWRPRH